MHTSNAKYAAKCKCKMSNENQLVLSRAYLPRWEPQSLRSVAEFLKPPFPLLRNTKTVLQRLGAAQQAAATVVLQE